MDEKLNSMGEEKKCLFTKGTYDGAYSDAEKGGGGLCDLEDLVNRVENARV